MVIAGGLLAVLLAERRRVAGGSLGKARGEAGDARLVVGDHSGEGEVRGQRRRRAGALRVVQRQVHAGAVHVLKNISL